MIRWFVGIGVVLAAAVAALIGAVLFFGGYNVAASSGHWGITQWLLRTAKNNSVTIRKPQNIPPDLDDPARIRLGAGHFASVCADCHGTPEKPLPAAAAAMTPTPPHFGSLTEGRDTRHLFWVVLHGIKMTGMPAWPALVREDEAWSMTAFLNQTAAMDEEQYHRLAYGPDWPESEDPLLADCARCHGLDGDGRGMKNLPALSQQKPDYLENALRAFRSGERRSGIMQVVAAPLTDEDIRRLARHYAAAPRSMPPAPPTDTSSLELGRLLALEGNAERMIPACSACHGPWPERRNPNFPEIRGQPEGYIRRQLELFRSDQRGGSAYNELMRPVARSLSDEDIDALARFYASLPPDD